MCAFHGWVHKTRIPTACLLAFVLLSVCESVCTCAQRLVGLLQQQTGLIMALNSPTFSGRKQTQLVVAALRALITSTCKSAEQFEEASFPRAH